MNVTNTQTHRPRYSVYSNRRASYARSARNGALKQKQAMKRVRHRSLYGSS